MFARRLGDGLLAQESEEQQNLTFSVSQATHIEKKRTAQESEFQIPSFFSDADV